MEGDCTDTGGRCVQVCTFNADLSIVLDVAEVWRGDARVRGRLSDVRQLEDVLADRHAVLRRQLDGAQPPLDARHRRPDRHAREVDRAARRHLRALGQDGEMRRNTPHCSQHTANRLKQCVVTQYPFKVIFRPQELINHAPPCQSPANHSHQTVQQWRHRGTATDTSKFALDFTLRYNFKGPINKLQGQHGSLK